MKNQVLVNGSLTEPAAATPDIREIAPGVYSIIHHGRSFQVRITRPERGVNGSYGALINGHEFAIEVRDPRDGARRANSSLGGGRQNIAASMPGKVVRVLVSAGQQVEAGQGLVVVEAMKMQNEMKALKPGKVVRISAQDGGTVSAGDILLVLE